jgi:hypothetical protein
MRIEHEEAVRPVGVAVGVDQRVEWPVVGEDLRALSAAMQCDDERQAVAAVLAEGVLDPVGPADRRLPSKLLQEPLLTSWEGISRLLRAKRAAPDGTPPAHAEAPAGPVTGITRAAVTRRSRDYRKCKRSFPPRAEVCISGRQRGALGGPRAFSGDAYPRCWR